MFVLLTVLAGVVALVRLYRGVVRGRRGRGRRDPLAQVFGVRGLREVDAHLERVAAAESVALSAAAQRYVEGARGHVVGALLVPRGVMLQLSDGRKLTLGGMNRAYAQLIVQTARQHRLRPVRVTWRPHSFRLFLRDEYGAEVAVRSRRLALTS